MLSALDSGTARRSIYAVLCLIVSSIPYLTHSNLSGVKVALFISAQPNIFSRSLCRWATSSLFLIPERTLVSSAKLATCEKVTSLSMSFRKKDQEHERAYN